MVKSVKAPSPDKTAATQSAMNLDTAKKTQELNMVNQSTPTGSLTYKQTGTRADGTPIYEAVQSLSPEQQQLYETRTGTQQNIGNTASTLSDNMAGTYSKPMNVDSETMNRLIDLGEQRLNPTYERKAQALEADLLNRGIRPGTEAYDRAHQTLNQAEADARNQLILSGYSTAENAALAERNQGLTDLNSLLGLSQPTASSYVNTPNTAVSGVDYAGLVQNNYNQKVAQRNAFMGGLSGLGGTVLGGWAKGGFST